MLVDEGRRLQRGGVEHHRVAQRRKHGPHFVEVVLNIKIFGALVLHAAQHKAVVEQIICALFQHFIRFGHLRRPPCGVSE